LGADHRFAELLTDELSRSVLGISAAVPTVVDNERDHSLVALRVLCLADPALASPHLDASLAWTSGRLRATSSRPYGYLC
jgi:hypothetical protein